MGRIAYHGTSSIDKIIDDRKVKSHWDDSGDFDRMFDRYVSLRREIIAVGMKEVGNGFDDFYYLIIGGSEVHADKAIDFKKYQRELHVWFFSNYERAKRYAVNPEPAVLEFNLKGEFEEMGQSIIVPRKVDFKHLTAIYVPQRDIEVVNEILIEDGLVDVKVKKL